MECLRLTANKILPVFLVAFLATGCGLVLKDRDPNVRVYDSPGRSSSTNAPVPTASVQVNASGVHVVQRGETLYAIARAYKTPLRTIITANNLIPPYKLNTGQRLTVPKARIHEVKRGDTVYGISRQYNVAMSELVRANGLREPYTIAVGQRLALPSTVVRQSSPAPVQTVARSSTSQPSRNAAPNTVAQPPEETTFTSKGYPKPAARPEHEPAGPTQVAAIPKPAQRSASKFLWPVQGRVITGFGPTGKGRRNDGLNIAAPRGTPVKAAENGVIAYSGKLQGYGNLVLVKHSDGYMTAYAHNGTILVRQGEAVRRGQTIARVGSSGNVDRPQLHFQLRRGENVLDPRGFLAG